MKTKARLLNILKNITITALAASAVLLMLLSMNITPSSIYKSILKAQEAGTSAAAPETSKGVIDTMPHAILLTYKDGNTVMHFAAKYDYQAKLRIMSQFSVSLGEAIGSAYNAVPIKESSWKAALTSTGIYLDFSYAQPLKLIAENLGTRIQESAESVSVRRLALAERISGGKSELCLYYINDETGDFYRLDTALNAETFLQRFYGIELPSSSLAFETGEELASVDPYFVFSGETISPLSVRSASVNLAAGEGAYSLEFFTINERTHFYTEDDATVFVDGSKNLRLALDGSLTFTASNAEGLPVSYSGSAPSLYDAAAACASVIAATIKPYCGDAAIGLISAENGPGDNSFVLSFGYYVNGIPVRLSNRGWCAKFTITNGHIVRAELVYRQYTIQSPTTGENPDIPVMPEKFMAGIAAEKGGFPLMTYMDSIGTLTPEWVSVM